MTADEFRALALSLPSVEEGFNMGSAVFKANGKVLARLLDAERAMLTGVDPDEIDVLTAGDPALFWADGHYRSARSLVVTLTPLPEATARGFLVRRFTAIAAKRVLKDWPG